MKMGKTENMIRHKRVKYTGYEGIPTRQIQDRINLARVWSDQYAHMLLEMYRRRHKKVKGWNKYMRKVVNRWSLPIGARIVNKFYKKST